MLANSASNHSNRNIALLVNPTSGKGKAVKIGHWLEDKLSAMAIPHLLFVGNWPSQFEQHTEIWIIGGDGTINYFVNHYKGIQLPLALFAGGTGNDFAWKLYGDISVEDQFQLLLHAEAKPVDVACCNDVYYLNSLGIGFDGEVLRSMNAIRWMGGHLGYLLVVIRKIFSFREFRFKINTGSEIFDERFLLVIINNSSRTGGGFMVSPKASLTDGLLDLVLCKPLSLFKRLRYLPVIEKGKHLDLPYIHFCHTPGVQVICNQETSGQIDGELITAKTFDIKVLPGCLNFRY
ncbi:MAG: diacylglycerol kinase family protein [Sphingobacteriales bacterium]|nr:diacylglycerol kinase family protein [Sphingobacteriales bacterium]